MRIKELIVEKNPKSPIAEIFRSLRTNIQFMSSNKNVKTLLLTSSMLQEGKTWIAANLATTFAQAGRKTILIDADMRRGRQHVIFKTDDRPGLSNYLSGVNEDTGEIYTTEISKYIHGTEINNLFLMPMGNIPPNPSELLSSKMLQQLIEQLKEEFDIVIFDGPPALLVTDALILARILDYTIIVTACNSTKKENLQKVKKNIENVGGKIAGVIVNKQPMSKKKIERMYYYGQTDIVVSKKRR